MNCIVCGIAKNENQYIYEWAEYHLRIGFSHIHIYDNNDTECERIADVFSGTAIADHITIHDVRGKTHMQMKVYQECYEREDFDWCAFIDIDEFITFTHSQMTISKFLMDKQEFEAVHLNWLCYGDDGQLKSDGRGVRERLAHPIQPIDFKAQYITIPENTHIKSIIKQGLKIDWNKKNPIVQDAQPHTPFGLTSICNEKSEPVTNVPWNRMSMEVAYVAHYITKTIDEYGIKVNRRSADSNSYCHTYARFFTYNELTWGKWRALKQVCPEVKLVDIWKDMFMWWNSCHHTLIAKLSKKYQRQMEKEKQWKIEEYLQ